MFLSFYFFYDFSPFVQLLNRYDILSDGLDDVTTDNNNTTSLHKAQPTLEDEEALDPIDNEDNDDDIWQDAKLTTTHENNNNENEAEHKEKRQQQKEQSNNSSNIHKLRHKVLLTRPYVAYEPLNNCDSLNRNSTTWETLDL